MALVIALMVVGITGALFDSNKPGAVVHAANIAIKAMYVAAGYWTIRKATCVTPNENSGISLFIAGAVVGAIGSRIILARKEGMSLTIEIPRELTEFPELAAIALLLVLVLVAGTITAIAGITTKSDDKPPK